jgi:hypothetical protein
MTQNTKKRIRLALAIVLIVVAGRAGYILYQRHEDYLAAQKQIQARNAGYSNADYYVTPRKLYPYDLKSAQQLTQQPEWVKEGYRYTYYPFNAAAKRVDFAVEAGVLGPIEKLNIKNVLAVVGPGGKRQVVAVFEKDAKSYAVPIGFEADGQYRFYSDEMFYVDDPHQLYKHWPADIWQAVDQHQVKAGMNELQADFAVGMGAPDAGASSDEKTVRYPNGGKPLVVEYRGGKATEIKAGS